MKSSTRWKSSAPKAWPSEFWAWATFSAWSKRPTEKFDQEETAKLQEKMEKGNFTLDDFMAQMSQIHKLGPMSKIMGMIPGMGDMMKNMGQAKGKSKAR